MNVPAAVTATGVAPIPAPGRIALSAAEFQGLTYMPAELEWFASIESLHTRRAYVSDIRDFVAFTGIEEPTGFRLVARSHVLAWRRSLEARSLSPATVRRKSAVWSQASS